MNMFLSQAAPELDLLGPQQRKYMHEQCHGGREGVTGIIFYTFLGASWGIIFIGIGPCWGRNLQKHHVEKRFAYHPVETRLLLCPSGGPRRKRKSLKLFGHWPMGMSVSTAVARRRQARDRLGGCG